MTILAGADGKPILVRCATRKCQWVGALTRGDSLDPTRCPRCKGLFATYR